MNNHLLIILIIAHFFIACSEDELLLISNTPSNLPDKNYKLTVLQVDKESLSTEKK